MLHKLFGAYVPSGKKVDPVVRAFIISETFFWSGQNMLAPIFGIFIVEQVSGGTVEAAGMAVTAYMIARIFSELIVGKALSGTHDGKKFWFSIFGIIAVALFYYLFIFVHTVIGVYILQALIGVAFGIVSPAKYALFSEHLDKGQESTEWGVYDAAIFSGMALTAMLGGFITQLYGFDVLFLLSSALILIGAIPFTVFVHLKLFAKGSVGRRR